MGRGRDGNRPSLPPSPSPPPSLPPSLFHSNTTFGCIYCIASEAFPLIGLNTHPASQSHTLQNFLLLLSNIYIHPDSASTSVPSLYIKPQNLFLSFFFLLILFLYQCYVVSSSVYLHIFARISHVIIVYIVVTVFEKNYK